MGRRLAAWFGRGHEPVLVEDLASLEDVELVSAVWAWIAANPAPIRFLRSNTWSDSAIATRCAVWMQELSRRTALPRDFVARATASIAEQVRRLEGHSSLEHVKALLFAGRFFTGAEAQRWTSRGLEGLAAQLGARILPDGVHVERSPSRHLEVFADLLECLGAIEDDGARRALRATLDRMAQVAVDLRDPDLLLDLAESLRVHAALGGRTGSPRPSFAFLSAGWFGLRGEESFLLVDGHAGAFEWSVGGLPFFVGAATRAEPAVLESCSHAEDSLRLVSVHDGSRHRRTVRATTRGIDVEDEFVGDAGGSARAQLHLHPEVEIEPRRDARSLVLRRKGVCVLLESASPLRVVPAGAVSRTVQVVIHYGLAPCAGEFSLRWVPSLREAAPDLDSVPSPFAGRTAPAGVSALQEATLT